ncbi:MAG: hypothetical protein A3D65_05005 [Candidatus Lloydbacteria bacterium RIFCSPHIGHO2_02_FULL_50_13]|uniref:Cytochrome b561 domain-containing protein n=1 Tax=Candidatus Lloydbacteria bacterium RIFCSPHIGHO2_02_FULL_50_13 TaxID=1798661 RepID=A0A1G2D4S2_9BACT|nr:MAG: hypothetical protein A3D65_05005 [Candidatus Lloydbacteria bacterium RIFCSPHIGHO2_02_FULL_50_13]
MLSTWHGMLVFFCFFYAASSLVFVWLQGYRSRGGDEEENALHRHWVKHFVSSLFLGVLGVEGLIQLHGGLWDTSWVAWLHWAFVVILSTLLVLVLFFFTGLKNPKVHVPLVYMLMVTFCGTLVTGSVLLSRFPG